MEKDLNVLQKEINLHVNDIERMQGHIGNLFSIKGNVADELRRFKDKSRKTQAFLSSTKKVQSSSIKTSHETSQSPKRSMTQTAVSGVNSTMGQLNQKNSLIVELLLFGPAALAKRGQITMTSSSFQQTASSGNTTGYVSPVFALKYIIKHCPITQFEISIFNSDGTRRTDTEEKPAVQPQQPGRKKKTQV